MKAVAYFVATALFVSVAVADNKTDKIEFARHRLLSTALAQSEEMSPDWDPGQRDCAGLVRFLYRRAVAGPAEIWRDRIGGLTAFVSAGELIGYNFTKVAEKFDPLSARTGDVLVFHRPDRKPEDAWHLMVLLEPPLYARREWLAIYHNGDRGAGGRVRVVSLGDLSTTVHGEWRPAIANPAFRGVFRWNQWLASGKK